MILSVYKHAGIPVFTSTFPGFVSIQYTAKSLGSGSSFGSSEDDILPVGSGPLTDMS